VHAALSRSKCW